MYNPKNQYRCTIIRGKSQTEMDNLLLAYAKIADEICPCDANNFKETFDNKLKPYLPDNPSDKSLANHRTEIAKKLFGLYYLDNDNTVFAAERTRKFLEDGDAPAFFKDICYKAQFPNGSQKYQTLREHIANNICIRPNSFLLKVMTAAKTAGINLTKKEIGYYILNSLDVLQGKASPYEVIEYIVSDRSRGIIREITISGKASSYCYQHINEQINLLELANLVIADGNEIALNPGEESAISLFVEDYNKPPQFNVYSYDLSMPDERRAFYREWDFYYAKLSPVHDKFETTATAMGVIPIPAVSSGETGVDIAEKIGNDGERYVYEYERKRVAEFNFRLANKVIHLGKTRGLGYDIQSVIAKPGDNSDFVKYIEVKATKRVTAPDINDSKWFDTLNITRNEWVAAIQHKDYYSIFRVYFTRNSIVMFVITDIAKKNNAGIITAVPTSYRIDFHNNAVDEVIEGGAANV